MQSKGKKGYIRCVIHPSSITALLFGLLLCLLVHGAEGQELRTVLLALVAVVLSALCVVCVWWVEHIACKRIIM
jgi:lysylphosphatidylglycerol synthetase-like protein (DUF2156 family)